MPRFKSPRWLCRANRNFRIALPQVYGPRGTIMIGKGLMSLCFGYAYIGVLRTAPTSGGGLDLVTRIMPIELWGVLWFLTAFMLISSAFRVDHSRALGVLTAMLSLWAMTYMDYYLRVPVLPNGHENTAFVFAALLASMALSAAGVARMLNHGKSHTELVKTPGEAHRHD